MNKWTKEYDNDTGPCDDYFKEWWNVTDGNRTYRCNNSDDADFLIAALAQPEQSAKYVEPVAWIERDMQCDDFDPDSVTCEKPARAADGWEWIPLYTTPPQRPWVGLTEDELANVSASGLSLWALWRAIEAKLKEKNS